MKILAYGGGESFWGRLLPEIKQRMEQVADDQIGQIASDCCLIVAVDSGDLAEKMMIKLRQFEGVLVLVLSEWNPSVLRSDYRAKKVLIYQGRLNWNWINYDLMEIVRGDESIEIRYDGLCLNEAERRLEYRGKTKYLRNKEFCLIRLFLINSQSPLSKNYLLEEVWDWNSIIETNTLEVHIHKLRVILKELRFDPSRIKNIPMYGYKLE